MKNNQLNNLGLDHYLNKEHSVTIRPQTNIGRIIVQHRNGYGLIVESGESEGTLRGRDLKKSKAADLPRVGDWVEFEKLQGENKVVITKILPRYGVISRYDKEKKEHQIIATNVDTLFIIQSIDQEFNMARIERFLIMAAEGGCLPVVLFNKSDRSVAATSQAKQAADKLKIITHGISAKTGVGFSALSKYLQPGQTIAFVGASGVGKSSIINNLLQSDALKTGAVRKGDGKGRHTTTKRELIILPTGTIVVDTPGMRELGLLESQANTNEVFADLTELSYQCQFRNCDHLKTTGCAILKALAEHKITKARYQNYLKLLNAATQTLFAKQIRGRQTYSKQGRKKISKK